MGTKKKKGKEARFLYGNELTIIGVSPYHKLLTPKKMKAEYCQPSESDSPMCNGKQSPLEP